MPLRFNDIRHKVADAVLSVGFGLAPHKVCIGGPAGQLAQVASLGTAGQVLASNGAGADPSWATAPIANAPHDRDVWLSGLGLPTGLGYTVLGETEPRKLATNAATFTSGVGHINSIYLPAGLTIAQMTCVVGQTAQAGGLHGWYAFLDNTFKVLAVTADQTGTPWTPAGQVVTLPFTASVVTSYRGVYYVACSISSSTAPNLCCYAQGANTQLIALAPAASGQGAVQSTPPAIGATYAITAAALGGPWAAVG